MNTSAAHPDSALPTLSGNTQHCLLTCIIFLTNVTLYPTGRKKTGYEHASLYVISKHSILKWSVSYL